MRNHPQRVLFISFSFSHHVLCLFLPTLYHYLLSFSFHFYIICHYSCYPLPPSQQLKRRKRKSEAKADRANKKTPTRVKTERKKGREKKTQVDQRTPGSNSTLTLEFVSANPEETRQTDRQSGNRKMSSYGGREAKEVGVQLDLEQGLPHTHKHKKDTEM